MKDRWSGFGQVVVALAARHPGLDLFLVPTYATDTPTLRDAFNVGIGASLHLPHAWDLVTEVTPANRDAQGSSMAWAVGFNKRVRGHAFLIYLGNSRATVTDMIAGLGHPGRVQGLRRAPRVQPDPPLPRVGLQASARCRRELPAFPRTVGWQGEHGVTDRTPRRRNVLRAAPAPRPGSWCLRPSRAAVAHPPAPCNAHAGYRRGRARRRWNARAASVVLVNVWATWCDPCRESFPTLLRLQARARRATGSG